MTTRKEILKQATDAVYTDREGQYGSPEDNFRRIADLWTAYWGGYPFEPKDVAMMMSLLKIARIATGKHKDDNYIDLAGYAACGGELGSLETAHKVEAETEHCIMINSKSSKKYHKVCEEIKRLKKEIETRDSIHNDQIDEAFKLLKKKDDEIRKLRSDLDKWKGGCEKFEIENNELKKIRDDLVTELLNERRKSTEER